MRVVNFGVESGDEQMLNVMKKGATVAQARQALRWSRELGFKTLASFLFGMPGETRGSIERTINFAIELNPHIALFNVLVPFPGTEVYARLPQFHTPTPVPWRILKRLCRRQTGVHC